ncbi:MAG: NUDIX domain-containing protein [Bacteroidetes bacterium]|nr:NUDIX domain-containing protein [Bacteroidota bacterium]
MNITVYYQGKKICINQSSQDQVVTDLDLLNPLEFKEIFLKFIQQNDESVLNFKTLHLQAGMLKVNLAFKVIEAAGGLIEQNAKYLFIYRHNRWDLPKGKLDKKETPERAAIRECEEECGITKLSIDHLISNTYHIYDYKGDYALKKTWWYAMKSQHTGKLVPQLEEDISRVEWFDKNEIRNEVLKNTYPLIQDILSQNDLV